MSDLFLSLSLAGQGHHPGAWRLPGASRARAIAPDFPRTLAARADAAGFDLLLAEYPPRPTGLPGPDRQEAVHFDALTLAAFLTGSTRRIGLCGTVFAAYTEPFNLARQMVAFDHVSRGRSAVLLVPGIETADRANFSRLDGVSARDNDARSAEFVALVKALYDSWEDAALALDKPRAIFAHPDKVHVIDHAGAFFTVSTSMNAPRAPQGHPVLVMAPRSDADFALAHAEADIVLLSGPLDRQLAGATRLSGGPPAFGDLYVTLAATPAEARALAARLDGLGPSLVDVEHFVGTPEDLVGRLAEWPFAGVNLLPTVLPEGLDLLADAVLPGLGRGAVAGPSLRDRLGLPRPPGTRS